MTELKRVAAQQIEGGTDEDGRGESIWDRFAVEQKQKVQDGSDARVVGQLLWQKS